MKTLLTSLAIGLFLAAPVSAQSTSSGSVSTSSGTLPETGIETPILIVSGIGLAFIASGYLFKKLQTN
jgi:LPXTG-motif cell wall-anchored protein